MGRATRSPCEPCSKRIGASSRRRVSENHGGRLRTLQNWIGGSAYNPCSAEFVPPPPEAVSGLLDDLVAFCNDDALPALAQAAIAHAQFETHFFVDGNRRTGRVLIHLVLRRRGLGLRVLAPVSLVLATWSAISAGWRASRPHQDRPDGDEILPVREQRSAPVRHRRRFRDAFDEAVDRIRAMRGDVRRGTRAQGRRRSNWTPWGSLVAGSTASGNV